jgi:thymidylate synthase (FAD)
MTELNVELKTERSTANPTETALMAARGDYMSDSLVGATFEDAMEGTDKTKRELVRDLLRKGHFGPFEHPQAFFVAEGVSRVTMAQITRHRHMSWDVQSMRYVDFEDAEVSMPGTFQQTMEYDWNDDDFDRYADAGSFYKRHVEQAFDLYQEMVDAGVPEEDARFVLPLGTQVNMSFSGNVRTLLHVLDLRHSGKAQWEVRKMAEQIIEEMRDWCPIVVEEWEDCVKNASLQSP